MINPIPKALAHDPIATARGRQIKAARALLSWSAAQLAHQAGLQSWHVHYTECGRARAGERAAVAVRQALERAGIRFADKGLGVRLEPGQGRG